MRAPPGLTPLVSRSTYLRAVHLLLGGVLLLPYALLGVGFNELLRSENPTALGLVLLAVAALIAGTPAFLRATRTLQTAAARALLDVELPELAPGPPALEARLRSALWFATHLATGGVVWLALLTAMPMALAILITQWGIGGELLAEQLGPLGRAGPLALTAFGFGLLVLVGYAVAGLGALAAMMAPALLGPSPAERIAALEAEASQLAERNRLARDLHDSVGHALTVTTLQAAAAREVLDTDPEFVARALRTVEEIGRAAMAELDHVLGLLRAGDQAARAPARTLSDLDQLLADARATGEISLEVTGPVDELPGALSREGYRIVQECLTNAARHADGAPVSVRLAVADNAVTIEVTNPVPGRPAGRTGGRGLAGIEERVSLLGGRVTAGQNDDQWRVAARLPLARRGRSTG